MGVGTLQDSKRCMGLAAVIGYKSGKASKIF